MIPIFLSLIILLLGDPLGINIRMADQQDTIREHAITSLICALYDHVRKTAEQQNAHPIPERHYTGGDSKSRDF
jgi:hypothetical protein